MIKVVPKKWGKEEWIINDEYCGKILTLNKDMFTSIHYHKDKKETMCLLIGSIRIDWYPFHDYVKRNKLICSVTLTKFQSFTVYPMNVHKITGLHGLNQVIEISTHHEDADSYRLRRNEKNK